MVDITEIEPNPAGSLEEADTRESAINESYTDENAIDDEDATDENTIDGENDRIGSWMDLMGNDLQLKVVQVDESLQSRACNVGDSVLVDFVGRQASDPEDMEGPIFHEANDWLVTIGDKEVCPALEMGIRFMKVGEHAIVYSHSKYAYGPMGRTHGDYTLPPNSAVIYNVYVKSIQDDVTPIQIALSKKQMGNDCYQHEWFDGHGKRKVLQLYQKAADAMTNVLEDDPEQEEARSILVDCLNNLAAAHLRAKAFGKAKEAATKVLLHDPDNLKGLCRAARAAMMDPAGTYEESDAAIAAAEQVNSEDADVKKIRAELERRKKEYKKKSKEMFEKMGKAMKPETTPELEKHLPEPPREVEILQEEEQEIAKQVDDPTAVMESPLLPSKTWFQRLLPYLIQVIMPFITYGIFVWTKKQAFERKANNDISLSTATNDHVEF